MSLLEAYAVAGVTTIRDLYRAYIDEDQRLFKAGEWDYENPFLLTNKVRKILSRTNLRALPKEEREWCLEILWFWHHHAISSAIWMHKDKEAARLNAVAALIYQGDDHPNQITTLLTLLVYDNLPEAEQWAERINDEEERETAQKLMKEYKAGEFF
ncbi:MAG TPA: hypothetical protein VHD31_00920 [Candidatus Paceibacterota bacterium]|nr:hypothetical protein [Candidatus Paceibacterota bacterium]